MLNQGDNRNFQRLSGKAYFQPVGQVGMICLGNIVMHKLDPKVERKDIMRYEGGAKRLARTDVLGVNPEYQIDGDEIYSLNLPLLLWGQRLADTVQGATGAVTATLNAVLPGMTYPLGGYVDVAVTAVTPTAPANAAALIPGTDYTVDAMKGLVTFLAGGAVFGGGRDSGDLHHVQQPAAAWRAFVVRERFAGGFQSASSRDHLSDHAVLRQRR